MEVLKKQVLKVSTGLLCLPDVLLPYPNKRPNFTFTNISLIFGTEVQSPSGQTIIKHSTTCANITLRDLDKACILVLFFSCSLAKKNEVC